MTSRVSFYKVMLQDLRHRLWMIALSCLGSFLAMPVFYLLISQEWTDRIERWTVESGWSITEYKIEQIMEFFGGYMVITGGIVLVAGALIVGLFGFRHVFSKKMIDQYHSIPVTRRMLFLANYLNGFLIWFIPMLVGALICAALAGFFMADFGAWLATLSTWVTTLLHFIIAFLLVYHAVIIAVMLSGNILNTLINGSILGFGVIALYSIQYAFANQYFSTYYSFFEARFYQVIWASPLASAIYQLAIAGGEEAHTLTIVMNVVMILAMGIAGMVLYLHRPSELAEQGMKIKSAKVIFKTIAVLLAGMCGWIFFDLLTGRLGWMIFGGILVGVLCYGILDIIFHMDFKAFFAHKIQMVCTVLAVLLVGFIFKFDLAGFDSYVPKKENIAAMGIYINNFGINSLSVEDRICEMEYTDQEVIHAFLTRMAARDEEQYPRDGSGRTAAAYVRVKEKSGRTYYRLYRVWESDKELVTPILMDEAYIQNNVLIPEEIIANAEIDVKDGHAELQGNQESIQLEDYKQLVQLYEAYNADLLAKPERYIYQVDDILGHFYVRNGGKTYYYLRMDIYESMAQTTALLKEWGYDYMYDLPKAEEIESLTFHIYHDKYSGEGLLQYLGLEGVSEEYIPGVTKDGADSVLNLDPNSMGSSFPGAYEMTVETVAVDIKEYKECYYEAVFTEQKDIKELLEVLTIEVPDYRNIFSEAYCNNVDVNIDYINGNHGYVHLKKGRFPEKFLDQFQLKTYE